MQKYLTTKDYPLPSSIPSCMSILREFNSAVKSLISSLSLAHCLERGTKLIQNMFTPIEPLTSLFNLICDRQNQEIYFSASPDEFLTHSSAKLSLDGRLFAFLSQSSFTSNLPVLYLALYALKCSVSDSTYGSCILEIILS